MMLIFRGRSAVLCTSLLCTVVFMLESCTSAKRINYFNDITDSINVTLPPVQWESRIIQFGDMLDVVFSAKEEEAVRPFNRQASTASPDPAPGSSKALQPPAAGYKVTNDGTIELPIIGKLPVAGKTADQTRDTLLMLAKPYMNDPRIEVKFTNFKVTMLGEVRSPGTYYLVGDRPNLFDALAAAGDLPVSARRYNVELYRDYNGSRTITKIDLTKMAVLNDQSKFQIRPNDVLYVRTRKSTIFRDDFSFFSAIATLTLTIVTLGFTLTN